MQEFRRWSNKVTLTSGAVRFNRNPTYHPTPDKISKRGEIKGFSRHSRLRLRDAICQCAVSGSDAYGLCLTVPWQGGFDSIVQACSVYRESWNRFTLAFRRALPNTAAIFRHELQRRKMPHTHLIVFVSKADLDNLSEPLDRLIFNLWFSSIKYHLGGADALSFARHGIKLDKLSDADAMFRYVSDHASKSKQAQLGYKGKQWGFINRKVVKTHASINYYLPDQKSLYQFQRHISRACRFRIKSDCVFGSRLSSSLNGVSVCFVKYSTTKKLLDFLRAGRSFNRELNSFRRDRIRADLLSAHRSLVRSFDNQRRAFKLEKFAVDKKSE